MQNNLKGFAGWKNQTRQTRSSVALWLLKALVVVWKVLQQNTERTGSAGQRGLGCFQGQSRVEGSAAASMDLRDLLSAASTHAGVFLVGSLQLLASPTSPSKAFTFLS